MIRIALAALLTLGASLALAPRAEAGPAAEAVIEVTADRIARGDYSASELSALIDTQRVARFTLGRHARTLDPADIDRYAAAFDTALTRTFERHGGQFRAARLEVVGSVDRNARDSIVSTRLHGVGEAPQTLRWRVIEREGIWRVVDVEALGIWLAIEQRAQVSAILGRRGATIDDVIHAFNRQIADLQPPETQG